MTRSMDLGGRRVLVTGGLGFIGSNLAIRCHEAGAQVTVVDILDAHGGGDEAHLRGYEQAIAVRDEDLRDEAAIADCLKAQELIFHCAGQTSHPYSMDAPLEDSDMNCRATLSLLEAVRRVCPSARIVYVASSTQIGSMRQEPIDEEHPEAPLDFYSASKSVCEKYLLIFHQVHGLRSSAVRLPNTYGPRGPVDRKDLGFVNYFIGLAAQGREITLFGDGHQQRNLLYVGDAVDALIAAALEPRCVGKALFAAGSRSYTVAELARTIVEVWGQGTIRQAEWPDARRRIDVGDAVIRGTRLQQLTGWSPAVDLRDGLRRTKAYFDELVGASP